MGTKEPPRKKIESYLQDVESKLKESVPYWDFRIEVRDTWKKVRKANGYDVLDDSLRRVLCPEPYLTLGVNFSIFCKWKGEKLSKSRWKRKKSEFQEQVDELLDSIEKKCNQDDEFRFWFLDCIIEGDDVEIPAEKTFYFY
ncbi:hypothetical protein [Snodgrassella alvi]|uniref:hypothetical protein n=1 Tax=Snodgrassella alvi TaxID=1196083 RepID=UPI003515AB68